MVYDEDCHPYALLNDSQFMEAVRAGVRAVQPTPEGKDIPSTCRLAPALKSGLFCLLSNDRYNSIDFIYCKKFLIQASE